jgi:hypothetical protein
MRTVKNMTARRPEGPYSYDLKPTAFIWPHKLNSGEKTLHMQDYYRMLHEAVERNAREREKARADRAAGKNDEPDNTLPQDSRY